MTAGDVVGRYLRAWCLSIDGTLMRGSNAFVVPVVDTAGRPCVLRVGDPSGDSALAWRVLKEWNGDGAVQLYRHDADTDVSLLERLDHRRTLDDLPIDEAVAVAGELRARLIRPAVHSMPLLSELATRWAKALSTSPRIPPELRRRAVGLCHDLAGESVQTHLLNPDLHYRNVLGGSREPWLVIDPIPLVGHREFGLASLVWGRNDESTTDRLMSSLIETGGLDPERARAWTMVESTAKLLTSSRPDVQRKCLRVARDLSSP